MKQLKEKIIYPLLDRIMTRKDEWEQENIHPIMMQVVRFLTDRVAKKRGIIRTDPEWKQYILDDFASWLDQFPEIPKDDDAQGLESCDLFTLLSEFSALKQEIHMQNREQDRTIKVLDSVIDGYRKESENYREAVQKLSIIEEQVVKATERRIVLSFLDIRDTLVRGKHACEEIVKASWFFKPRGIQSTIEGYEMALRKFDKLLSDVEVFPVETVGKPFDSRLMRAVDKRLVPDKEKGIVLEELVCGFVRGEEVIRIAEVIVNED